MEDQSIEEALEANDEVINASLETQRQQTSHAEKLASLGSKDTSEVRARNNKVASAEIRRFLTNAYTFIGSLHFTEQYLAYDLRQAVSDRIEELSGTPRVLARRNRIVRVEHLMRAAKTYIEQAMDMDDDELTDEAFQQSETSTSAEGVLSMDKATDMLGGGLTDMVSRAKSLSGAAAIFGVSDELNEGPSTLEKVKTVLDVQ